MSYIVPMKKPICINCPFRNLDSCTLIYLMSDKDSEVTVHVNEMTVSPDCPLVEIPPHGDLTDKDKLMQEFMDSDLDHLQRDDWKEVIQIVSDAEVIIEAEGETE